MGRDGRASKSSRPEAPGILGFNGSFPTQDRAKDEALNKKLRRRLSEFRVPPVMLYVKEKVLNGDLEKTIKTWERKVEIAEVSHREAPAGRSFTAFVFLLGFRISG